MCSLQTKIVLDSVHGTIDLVTPLVRIIDTPEFQRLRNVKQLESITFVYPCAQHSRFEHSIGTAYLAGLLIESLRKNQPEMNIDDKDVLCVKIAGLCHDLGHGPFSHLFESLIYRIYLDKNPDKTFKDAKKFYQHEQASLAIFDRIFEKVKEHDDFKQTGLDQRDKEFIKELINPEIIKRINKCYEQLKAIKGNQQPVNDVNKQIDALKSEIETLNAEMISKLGRNKDKSFLFEIVSNFRNSIDVDKWDYFARDALNLGIHTTFDYKRFILNCRIINPDETLNQICVRDNELRNVYEMFRTREDLYKRAYMHAKSVGIKEMILDTLYLMNDFVGFYDIVSNLNENLDKYLDLDDRIIYLNTNIILNIVGFPDELKEKLKKSKAILDRLLNRQLYKLARKCIIKANNQKTVQQAMQELQKAMNNNVTSDDFTIADLKINFGNGDRDPLENLQFYEKNTFKIVDKKNITEYNSQMKPQKFEEITWNLYIKNRQLADDKQFMDNFISAFDKICQSD